MRLYTIFFIRKVEREAHSPISLRAGRFAPGVSFAYNVTASVPIPHSVFPMKPSISFYLMTGLAVLVAFASACTAVQSPFEPTSTPVSPLVDMPTPSEGQPAVATPALVAFPTAAPATATASAPTVTLVPASGEGRAGSGAPVVQVVSPLPGAQVSISQTVYVVAYAASDNTIARVELSDDGSPVSAETPSIPLSTFSTVLRWTPALTGTHTLRVTAFDNNNRTSAEELNVAVTPDTRRPTSTILYPIGTPQVELGSVLQIYAAASDEVGIKRLDLWADNQLYTYVVAENPAPAAFPTVFAWNASSAGNHALFVRATDTQDQTYDSPPLKVFVVDTHAPALSMSFDRQSVGVGEPMTITVTALDVSGIQRVELWTGKEVSNTVTSVNPARQTSLSAQFAWANGAAGDYTITARAYNTGGTYKDSPAQTVSVLRQGQPNPTRPATLTPTRTRTPRPQPTPRLQPPAPPTVEITQPADHFVSQGPLRFTISARASAELDRIELWGYYQSQPNPQLLCTIDARATTSKTAQCDWTPTDAGVLWLYAQVIDNFQQYARSPVITGIISVPGLPTPTPTPASLAGRWTAAVSAGQYALVFRPIATASGVALRGDFKVTSAATPSTEMAGRVVSGSVKGDRATFRVEFTAAASAIGTPASATSLPTTAPTAAPTVTPSAPALDFDCGVDATAATLDCKTKDARGATSTALFRREGP